VEKTKKKVQELETKNSKFWNELPKLHKWLIEINKTLSSIDLE
jgi:hypothetical protein